MEQEDAVEFTVNLRVISKKAWDDALKSGEEWMGKSRLANIGYPNVNMWENRLACKVDIATVNA